MRKTGTNIGKGWMEMTNEEVIRTSHIDREAWEPCPECGPNRLIMGDKYCCECGRPLTEEAWAELEKRVRGWMM